MAGAHYIFRVAPIRENPPRYPWELMLVKAFWGLAALNAAGLLTLFVLGLRERGHNDGGREMALIFYVIVPAILLVGTAAMFSLVSMPLVRWLCLAVVAAPIAFYAYVAFAQFGLSFVNDPSNAYQNPAMKKLVRAVTRLDVEEVKRWAPQMDKDIDQMDPNAPLRMLIDMMVQEKKTRLPAQIERHLEIFEILLKNGAKPNSVLRIACWPRSGELLRMMFAAGADPNYTEEIGGPVFFACLDGGLGVTGPAVPMVKEFVSAGVAVNRPSDMGFLPATYAADCSQYDAALYLLDHGAEPDQADRSGKTLRDVVAEKRKSAGAAVPEELKKLSERLGMH